MFSKGEIMIDLHNQEIEFSDVPVFGLKESANWEKSFFYSLLIK